MLVGRLVVVYNLIIFCVIIGVRLLGLNIIVLFVINVGIMWLLGRCLGKLYGLNIVIMLWGLW